jgi:hypothetical protein
LSLRSQCQDSLLSFLQALIPDFDTTCHHEALAKLLETTLTDSATQKISISCPPRIGKSSNTIRSLAWAAGNSEYGLNHFVATYGLELSNQHKRIWNATIDSDIFRAVFSKKKAESLILPLFTSPAGVGTGVAAGSEVSNSLYRGALVFDDMVKVLTREPLPMSVTEWYTSVASTRRQKRWASINIGTRFGLHDFSAMLKTIEGEYHPIDNPDGYKFLNFPALLSDGTSFWENSEHMNTRILTKLRDNPATSETFWTIYQGEPEFCLTKEDPIDPPDYDPALHGTKIDSLCSIDTSKGMSDPTGVLLLSVTDQGYWVLENFWELWGLQSVSTLKTALNKLKLPKRGIVEGVGFGTALEYTQFNSTRPKRDRLISALTTLQTKFVKAHGLNVERFVHQINDFGAAQYDDLADCASQAIIFYPKLGLPVMPKASSGLTVMVSSTPIGGKGRL